MAAKQTTRFKCPDNWTIAQRLAHYSVRAPNGCLEWTGARTPDGYGWLYVGGRPRFAHRLSWEEANEPIPDGMLVCHHCDNPPCIDDAHLFLGTIADNNADRGRKGRSFRFLGAEHPMALLSEAEALAIFLAPGPYKDIAAAYGVSVDTVGTIKNKRGWAHLHGERNRQPQGRTPKLTAAQALAIFAAEGKYRDIAAQFGISSGMVSHIKAKRMWRSIHLTPPPQRQ